MLHLELLQVQAAPTNVTASRHRFYTLLTHRCLSITSAFLRKSAKHTTDTCQTSSSIIETKERLTKAMRCYWCTRAGHRSKQCTCWLAITCSTCKRRTFMCDLGYKACKAKRGEGRNHMQYPSADTGRQVDIHLHHKPPAGRRSPPPDLPVVDSSTQRRHTLYTRRSIGWSQPAKFYQGRPRGKKLGVKVVGETSLAVRRGRRQVMCRKSVEHIGTKWSCDTETFLEASPACPWHGCFDTTDHN